MTYIAQQTLEWITDNFEPIINHPYGIALGAITLSIGAYGYMERKLHVARSVDDLIIKAKKNNDSVNVSFNWCNWDSEARHYEGEYGNQVMLRAGKIRYTIGVNPSSYLSIDSLDREKTAHYIALLQISVLMAEEIQNKGLEVTIRGENLQERKNELFKLQQSKCYFGYICS